MFSKKLLVCSVDSTFIEKKVLVKNLYALSIVSGMDGRMDKHLCRSV